MADIPGDSSTTATITVGGTVTDSLEIAGDHDWFAITLTAGQEVTISLDGITLQDPYLYLRDSSGNVVASNDDIVDGINRNSKINFDPGYSGTYYIDVGAFKDAYTGTYRLSVQPYTPPFVATFDQIADQLVNGFWDGDHHHFDVTQRGTLTVNISTLTAAEQTLARAALQEWSDIIGLHFQEVTTGAQITFDDTEDSSGNPVAATDAVWSNGITTSAHVHISTSWVQNYGTGLNTYSFQTYIHEIGHALGLGHSGDYNDTATYPNDAKFLNDAWSTSVMSYFNQHENYWFNNQSFSLEYAVTPMGADILAMQTLYGLSTTTRTGDTTYGYHSNAGGIYDATVYPNVAYTIFDNGGTDTLDFSGSSANQTLNLNAETFSSVNGNTGNLYIARGVVIENAIGGSGDDTIIQNSANNDLSGGAGNDTVSYETATAGVTVDLNLTTPQDTGGAGVDTLNGFENIIGSAYSDRLTAAPSTVTIHAGEGDNWIDTRSDNPGVRIYVYAGNGNNTFLIGSAPISIFAGTGFNVVDASGATSGISLVMGAGMGNADSVYVEKAIGTNFADFMWATIAGESAYGGAGDDSMNGVAGTSLFGGPGNDTYTIGKNNVQITENPGEGIDTVVVFDNYTLGPNLENLTLSNPDPYAGAALPPGPIFSDWSATGNELANVIIGNIGNNIITGLGGADILTGGGGNDKFQDTATGHNGDTITDFSAGDKIVFTDATLGSFSFSIMGNTLTYTGGSLTLSSIPSGHIVAQAAAGGGVQLVVASHMVPDDFNGDGRSDILWRDANGMIFDFVGTASGGVINNGANSAVTVGANSHVAGLGDFNGDGHTDILWRNDNGTIFDFLGSASGGFTNNGDNSFVSITGTSQVVGVGDFNGDGRSDILWRDANGTIFDFLGTANGGYINNGANSAVTVGADWHVVGTGDFNGDAFDDILWRNDNGTIFDFLGTANGGFTNNGDNSFVSVAGTTQVVGVGDFNGDGRSDILWRDANGTIFDFLGTANGGYTNNGANSSVTVSSEWHVVSVGDFNGDGRADVLWRNDNGDIFDFLGTPNGGFANNGDNSYVSVVTTTHVQDPFL